MGKQGQVGMFRDDREQNPYSKHGYGVSMRLYSNILDEGRYSKLIAAQVCSSALHLTVMRIKAPLWAIAVFSMYSSLSKGF